MNDVDLDERTDIIEEALGHITAAAELVRSLHDSTLDSYVLPQLEGAERGWLGTQAVDYLRAALTDAQDG